MRTQRALFYTTLTCALALITTTYAAPLSEPTATTTAEGLAATLEISKLSADLSNNIPSDFTSADGATLQPYASTDVDTVAELAPTSLPMTKEEMALAEVAAVVAELATTTAAELKVKEDGKYTEEEMEAMQQIWRNAEEAKRQVIAHELANVVDTLEGGRLSDVKDFVAATTLRTTFAETVATTTTPRTTASPAATTESPQILNELVRAAVAANEILAAALNAANLATTSTNMTQATAVVASENTIATTVRPALVISNEAGSVDGLVEATVSVSDNEGLSEAVDAVTWRPNVGKTEASNVDVEGNGEKSIIDSNTATATTTETVVERGNTDTTSNLNDSAAVGGAGEFEKSSEIQITTQLDVQETTTTASSAKSAGEVENEQPVEPILWRAGEFLLEHNNGALNKEEVTSEAAELQEHSKTKASEITERAIEKESLETTTTATSTGSANEVENEPSNVEPILWRAGDFLLDHNPGALTDKTNMTTASTEHSRIKEKESTERTIAKESLETTTVNGDIPAQPTELPKDFEASTPHPNNVAEEQTNIVETANQATPQATDNDKEFSETQIAEVVEVKQTKVAQDDNQVKETTTSSLGENSNLIPTTTEPLETLIAVESEAQEPNKIISQSWNELEKEVTTTIPEVATAAENVVAPLQPIYADLNHQEAITTTATLRPDETEAATESELEVNSETSLPTTTPAGSADQAENTPTSLASNVGTTTPTSAQTELPNISEVPAMEAVPITTERSVAEALDTQQLPTTTPLSAVEQHQESTHSLDDSEQTTTAEDATTIPSEVSISQATAAVPHEITTSSAERVQETTYPIESKDSSTDVPLAPFTTTPKVMEEFTKPEVTTGQSELAAYAVVVGSTETPQPAVRPSFEIPNETDTFAATLSSGSTETTKILANIESAAPVLTTPAAERGELHVETVEPAVKAKTLETLAEPIADQAVTKSVLVEERALYERTTTEPQQQQQQQQQVYSHSESESESTTTPTTIITTAEVESETAATTSNPNQVDITTITTTTTTSAPEPEIVTTTTTAEPETTTTTTTTTTGEPETTTTTTTTTSAPEPEIVTTTTTAEPETTTTTTTTTTLSPMSLIVAEHEARSLDRTPPRVSRIVSEDGVEVLTGYSIVHHIYAAALAAFEAGRT